MCCSRTSGTRGTETQKNASVDLPTCVADDRVLFDAKGRGLTRRGSATSTGWHYWLAADKLLNNIEHQNYRMHEVVKCDAHAATLMLLISYVRTCLYGSISEQ